MTTTALKQPRGLYNLFSVEMWERFGFYCVQSLLVLYLSKARHLSDSAAYDLFSVFSTLILATPIIGGYLADRLIGYRKSILLGGVLYTLGYFALATTSQQLFYLALALQICGNGFFKGCISSLLGTLYPDPNDPRRDSGFTIFYMGINIGAFLSPIICAWAADQWGWGYGFALAGVGMVVGLITVITGFRQLGDKGLPPNPQRLTEPVFLGLSRQTLFFISVIVALFALIVLITHATWVMRFFNLFVIAVTIILFVRALRYQKEQRNKMFALLILMAFSVLFWALYNQTFSSLTLFTDRVIDRHFFSWTIPTAMYQAVNSFFIITCSPFLAILWLYLDRKDWNPSTPTKFALGLLFLALGFLVLPLGVALTQQNLVSQWWLIFSYFLQTMGELCLSPIGMAMITALAPKDLTAVMMGAWFLSVAMGYSFGDYIANLASIPANLTDLSVIRAIYSHVFNEFGWITLGIGILLLFLTPWLKRLMSK